MPKIDRKAWAEEQLAELMKIGVALPDAEASVARVLASLGEDDDPATYFPDAGFIGWMGNTDDAAVQDARVDWYTRSSVPARFKRLLDAKVAD